MKVLGLGYTDHEASAALVIDGLLSAAVAKERLTRVKRDGKRWGGGRLDLSMPVRDCLGRFGLTPTDIDLVVWSHIDHIAHDQLFDALASEGADDLSARPQLILSHHFAHACAAFYSSPFAEAVVMVADGAGGSVTGAMAHCAGPEADQLRLGTVAIHSLDSEPNLSGRERESFYRFDGSNWHCLGKVVADGPGLGGVYASATELLFGDCLNAGKTMGLAPYGRPPNRALFLARTDSSGLPTFRSAHPLERDEWEERIRSQRPSQPTDPLTADFAAGVQAEVEAALLEQARWLRRAGGSGNLSMAGGVALNCVANSVICRGAGFDSVFVPSAPGDDGIAIGCALFGAATMGEPLRRPAPVYLGREYPSDPVPQAGAGLRVQPVGSDLLDTVADALARGEVVAWYRGGSELGPRALGHRSFLADARVPTMRDYLNYTVKAREPFRPFAPVVLAETVGTYFEDEVRSPFMSFVARVRPEWRDRLPAVTHLDGTARYQTLERAHNPELHELIRRFETRTGVAMLLNTSFNRAGEPLVETPADAVRCFLASSADLLVLGERVFRAADQPARTTL